ncbi:MAG: BamA/TamA family outer membrane protein [Acidobacteria bacterium]|nr:BamA/TamA family outer membrane protein [Acidobacteriota bacterium]
MVQSGSDQAPESERRRIVRQPIKRTGLLAVADGLKYPFHQFGRAFEMGLVKVERDHALERVGDLQQRLLAKGYQPLVGGMGPGAGFAFGVTVFRENFRGTSARLDLPLQYSTNGYVSLGASLAIPLGHDKGLVVKPDVEFQRRPQEDFFGLGPGSSQDDRSNFSLRQTKVGVTLSARLSERLRIGLPLGVSTATVSRGTDNLFPDLQTRFADVAIPGARTGADLVSVGTFLEWDFRNNPGNPTAGGRWRLDVAHSRDVGGQDFRFMRYAVEATHYLPLDDEHVLAARVLGVFNDEAAGAGVPFFLKATLGGKETMRGFREFRFYDDNAVLVSLEYRWRIWEFADAVLFVDEGQVAPEPRDFYLGGFRSSQGAGLRFKSDQAQILRVDIGRSREGRRLYISFASRF